MPEFLVMDSIRRFEEMVARKLPIEILSVGCSLLMKPVNYAGFCLPNCRSHP